MSVVNSQRKKHLCRSEEARLLLHNYHSKNGAPTRLIISPYPYKALLKRLICRELQSDKLLNRLRPVLLSAHFTDQGDKLIECCFGFAQAQMLSVPAEAQCHAALVVK